MADQKKGREKPRAFATDEKGAAHRLTIEKEDAGYRVSVRSDDEPDGVLVEAGDDGFDHVAALLKLAGAEDGDRILVLPKGGGIWEVVAIADDEAKAPVVVEFSESASPDATAQIDRLFRVLGEEELVEDQEERPIDADDADRALVHPAGRRTSETNPHHAVDTYPSDILRALHEVADLINGRPGDPGRGVHLVRRVESVLEEFERRGGGGR